jgi:hypothetical protein
MITAVTRAGPGVIKREWNCRPASSWHWQWGRGLVFWGHCPLSGYGEKTGLDPKAAAGSGRRRLILD